MPFTRTTMAFLRREINRILVTDERNEEDALTMMVTKAATMKSKRYQWSTTHLLSEAILSSESKRRRSVANGPEGSTSRQRWNTSQ